MYGFLAGLGRALLSLGLRLGFRSPRVSLYAIGLGGRLLRRA
jgi:hypothetical protein